MSTTDLREVACTPYELVETKPGTLIERSDGRVEVEAESVYLVRYRPDAPHDVLRGALRILPGAREGQLRFGNFIGRAKLGARELEVRSTRLRGGEVDVMLSEVSQALSALPFAARTPVTAAYERSALDGPDVLYQAYAFIRHAMQGGSPHDLPAAVARILFRPHETLHRESQVVPLAAADRIDGGGLIDLLGHPERLARVAASHPLAGAPVTKALHGHVPITVPSRRARLSTNTRENRFVAYVLQVVRDAARRMEQRAYRGTWPGNATVAAEAAGIADQISRWLRHPALAELSAEPGMPVQSTVLRARPGYRELAALWRDLQARTRLVDPETMRRLMELRDAATTYELWCHLAVIAAVETVTGERAVQQPFAHDEDAVRIPWGHRAKIGAVEVIYNRAFPAQKGRVRPGHSYSVGLRPDITVETADGTLHLFDAKLKRDIGPALGALTEASSPRADDEAESETALTFNRADLHKMHAYRDALGARSVWILYPGDETTCDEYPADDTFGADRPPNGVGALSLRPGSNRAELQLLVKRMLG